MVTFSLDNNSWPKTAFSSDMVGSLEKVYNNRISIEKANC